MEVKWIKLAADLFENRKIRQIEALPEGDSIIVIWVKLLCLAGNINDDGLVYFTPEIPYTEEMMATQFGRPLPTVRMALQVFERFGMIRIEDDLLKISNWNKYQDTDKLATMQEKNRERVARFRERKRLEGIVKEVKQQEEGTGEEENECNVTVTLRNAVDIDIDKELDKEKEKDIEKTEEAAQSAARVREIRHKYGEYNNVLLSDTEYTKLTAEFPDDYRQRIESLSAYMKSTGKSYKDHLATIRNWARRDGERQASRPEPERRSSAGNLNDFYVQVDSWASK